LEAHVRAQNGKLVDGLSLHKSSGRFYSLTRAGKRVYWGGDRSAAIHAFKTASEPKALVPFTDEDAFYRVTGDWNVAPDAVTPELIEQAKRNIWNIDEAGPAKHPQLKEFIDNIGKPGRNRTPRGFRSLAQVSKRWRNPANRTDRPNDEFFKESACMRGPTAP
jgi:hypothetical protein